MAGKPVLCLAKEGGAGLFARTPLRVPLYDAPVAWNCIEGLMDLFSVGSFNDLQFKFPAICGIDIFTCNILAWQLIKGDYHDVVAGWFRGRTYTTAVILFQRCEAWC